MDKDAVEGQAFDRDLQERMKAERIAEREAQQKAKKKEDKRRKKEQKKKEKEEKKLAKKQAKEAAKAAALKAEVGKESLTPFTTAFPAYLSTISTWQIAVFIWLNSHDACHVMNTGIHLNHHVNARD